MKMRKQLWACLGILVGLLIVGCQNSSLDTPDVNSGQLQPAYPAFETRLESYPGQVTNNVFRTPEPPKNVPAPADGQSVVSGVLYSMNASMLVPGTLLYLTPATGPEKRSVPPIISGPDDANGDIRGMSNEKAQFVLVDVPPGNYYLVVSSGMNWSLAQSADTQQPQLIQLAADNAVDLGIVYLSWP
jgi:hypothetical protein